MSVVWTWDSRSVLINLDESGRTLLAFHPFMLVSYRCDTALRPYAEIQCTYILVRVQSDESRKYVSEISN